MTAIDLFAGLGGWTEGATQAGLRVLWAANHWQSACDCHEANHPQIKPVCQDLRQADFSMVPRHDVLLASPSCKGHSLAKGKDLPRHDHERATAWAVVECAECHRPPYVVVENVSRFLRWVLYPAWKGAMEALGYTASVNLVDFADLGVPQNRVRPIIIFTRSRAPIVLDLPRLQHVPVSRILGTERNWSSTRTKCPNTRARIAAGRREFGERFVIPYYSNGSGLTGRSLNRPLGTVTTVERYALVEGNRMGMLTVDEYRQAMSFPASYKLPPQKRLAVHLLGNAVPPRGAEIILNALQRAA